MRYQGMDQAALDAAYNNGAAVGPVKRERYAAERVRRSDQFRAQHPGWRKVSYGEAPRQRLDVHPCDIAGAPTLAGLRIAKENGWKPDEKPARSARGEKPARRAPEQTSSTTRERA